MKSVIIKLTKRQQEQIEALRSGAAEGDGQWGIFGQAYVFAPPLAHKAGTAAFYYCTGEQFKAITRAVARAKKL